MKKIASDLPNAGFASPAWRLARYAIALSLVALSTIAGLLLARYYGNAPVVLLFLPPVLLTAAHFGLRRALFTAVASTLAYNFYFTRPYYSLAIHNAGDIVTVLILFMAAVVTSHLAASLRTQARLAAAHAQRNATIAGLARRLLSSGDADDIAMVAVSELSRVFGCRAVFAVGPDTPNVIASAPDQTSLSPSDIAAAALAMTSGEVVGRGVRRVNLADWQFHPVKPADTTIASVGLARDDGVPPVGEDQLPLLGNLLDQVALALERARLDQEAREVIVLRERDRLRSVLLASTGEEIKPRLNAIGAAARALRREATGDRTLIANIAAETISLDRFVDNLVDLAPGSDLEPIEIGDIAIDLNNRTVRRDGAEVHLTPKEYALLAELAKHAGRVLTHEYLLKSIWGPAHSEHIDYLRVAIRSLRQKLEAEPSNPAIILNEPAVGYRLSLK